MTPASLSPALIVTPAWSARRPKRGAVCLAPCLLVMVLFGAAVVLAPEHPQDQAAICQRHNGDVACRVW